MKISGVSFSYPQTQSFGKYGEHCNSGARKDYGECPCCDKVPESSYRPVLNAKGDIKTFTVKTEDGIETFKAEVMIDGKELKNGIANLAEKINKEYKGMDGELQIICALNGAKPFSDELQKSLDMPFKVHEVKISSYGNARESSGHVKIDKSVLPNLKGEKVLILDDIIDKGHTLKNFSEYLQDDCSVDTDDIKIAVMLDKKDARKVDIEPDFSAFEIPNEFVVGFGLDYKEKLRKLPYVISVDVDSIKVAEEKTRA